MSSYQIIKLKNGEDLICNVLDNENGRLKVTTPLKMETVNRISKKLSLIHISEPTRLV